jgi:hypothetical protein
MDNLLAAKVDDPPMNKAAGKVMIRRKVMLGQQRNLETAAIVLALEDPLKGQQP